MYQYISQSQQIHKDHHRSPATPEDPDSYHIRGSWLGIIPQAFLSPEISAITWVRTHGVSQPLLWDWLGKWAILITLVLAFGYRFLSFWLFLRLIYGLGDLVFFRITHHRQGDYGTFAIRLAPWVSSLAGAIAGSTVV